MNNDPLELQDEPITIDISRLLGGIRRRARKWTLIGLGCFGLALVYQLFRSPQPFSSTVSVVVQQPSVSGTSPLSALLGQGGNSRKYMGILHSRRLAETVEKQIHLKQLYDLKTERKAIRMLMDSAKPLEKSDDGLLTLQVSLPGPPLLASGVAERRKQIAQTVALAANAYIKALSDYYVYTDNDRDTVLLREAETLLNRYKSEYEGARGDLSAFVLSLRKQDSRYSPSTDGQLTSAQDLLKLYEAYYTAETELRAAEAAQQKQSAMLANLLTDPGALSSEDPLLRMARDDVNQAQTRLDNLSIKYAQDSPLIRDAKERLKLAQARLAKQAAGVREKHTTEQMRSAATLEKLRAARDTLQGEIKLAEGRLVVRRNLSNELYRLKSELEIQFEKLKSAEVKVAELRLSTVSGQSRIMVVDPALPPEAGELSLARLLGLSLLASIGGVLASILLECRATVRQSTTAKVAVVPLRGHVSEAEAEATK